MMRAAAIVTIGLCACAEPYVLVEIEARDVVRDAVELSVAVSDRDGKQVSQRLAFADAFGFPRTLTIATDGRTGPFTVQVLARGADGEPVGAGIASTASAEDDQLAVLLEPEDFGVNAIVRFEQRLGRLRGGRPIAVADDGSFLVVWESERVAMGRLFGHDARPTLNHGQMSDLDFPLATDSVDYDTLRESAVAHGANRFLTTYEARVNAVDRFDGQHRVLETDRAAPPTTVHYIFGRDEQWIVRKPAPVTSAGGSLIAYLHTDDNASFDPLGIPMVSYLDEFGEPTGAPAAVAGVDSLCRGRPSLAAVADDRAVAVWADFEVALGRIRGRFISTLDGTPLGAELELTSQPDREFTVPVVVPAGDGGFVAAWLSSGADDTVFELQRFDASGKAIGPPTQITSLPDPLSEATVELATDGFGTIAAVWTEERPDQPDDPPNDVWFRVFRPNGMPIGEALRANTAAAGAKLDPAVAARHDGSFVVAWSDSSGRAPDIDGSGVRARVVYPVVAPRGGIGGTCDGPADCGAGLTCVSATGLCHPECADPVGVACNGGGTCSNGACLFQ